MRKKNSPYCSTIEFLSSKISSMRLILFIAIHFWTKNNFLFFFFLSLQNFNFSQGLYNRLNLEYKHRTFLTTKYKNDFSRWHLFFLSVKIIAKIRVWLSSIYRSDCLDVSYAFLSRRSSYDPEFVFFFFCTPSCLNAP